MRTYIQAWIVSALVIAGLTFIFGYIIRKRVLGIFIDSRNRISLSQFQIVLWTVVIVSAFFAVAWGEETLNIYIPPEIWALMAISTGSAAGAVIIKGVKSDQEPTPHAVAIAAARSAPAPPAVAAGAAAAPAQVARIGLLALAKEPRFTDMFKGEEITEKDYVDISKVQMFFFTLAAIVGYVVVLLEADLGNSTAAEPGYTLYFPVLSTSLVTLIGISHVGYLTVKAAPHTPTVK